MGKPTTQQQAQSVKRQRPNSLTELQAAGGRGETGSSVGGVCDLRSEKKNTNQARPEARMVEGSNTTLVQVVTLNDEPNKRARRALKTNKETRRKSAEPGGTMTGQRQDKGQRQL